MTVIAQSAMYDNTIAIYGSTDQVRTIKNMWIASPIPEGAQSEKLRRKQFNVPSVFESADSPSSQNDFNNQRQFKRENSFRTTLTALSNYIQKCRDFSSNVSAKTRTTVEPLVTLDNFRGRVKRSTTFVNRSSSYNVKQRNRSFVQKKRSDRPKGSLRSRSPPDSVRFYIRKCDSMFFPITPTACSQNEANVEGNPEKRKKIDNYLNPKQLFTSNRKTPNKSSNLNKSLSASSTTLSQTPTLSYRSSRSISLSSLHPNISGSPFLETLDEENNFLKDRTQNEHKIRALMRGFSTFLRNSKKKFKLAEVSYFYIT